MNETRRISSPVEDLTRALADMAISATGSNADDFELRQLLRFVGQVVQIVDQSFEPTYAVLIDIANLSPGDLQRERHRVLRHDLDMILARSHFRDSTEICSRLRHLSAHYTEAVEPIISNALTDRGAWADIFALINEYEGGIIIRVEAAVSNVGHMLDTVDEASLNDVRQAARIQATALREDLNQLRDLNGHILGLSGKPGLMELTATTREEAIQVVIADTFDNRYMDQREGTFMGDTFSNISNSTVVNRSTVSQAFNVAQARYDEETAQTLARIAEAVAASENKDAGEALDMLNEELTKDAPRSSILKLAWDGLVTALPPIAKIAGASAAIAKLLA
jgi:hypothetical protein